MKIDFGVINVGGAQNGTLTHPAITSASTIQMTLQRDVSEDALPLAVVLVGAPRSGEADWELNQGHDNNVFLHYIILNN